MVIVALVACTSSGAENDVPAATTAGPQTATSEPDEATLFVAPFGLDEDPCSLEAPCASLDRAFELSTLGDVIEVAGGEYPAQEITPRTGAGGTGPVVVRPPDGEPVTLANVEITGSDVELRGMRVGGFQVRPGAADVTLRDIDTEGQSIIESASQIAVLGGDIGPTADGDGLQIKPKLGEIDPTDILIDGVRFHDVRDESGVGHIDCIQVGGATNITIRNSTFERCAVRDVIFGSFNGGEFNGALIENNWFGPTTDSSLAVQAEEAVGMTFRYNSLGSQGVAVGTNEAGGARDNHVVANVGPLSSGSAGGPLCAEGTVRYAHNVWSNAACAPTDTQAPSGFVDEDGFDYRLTRDAAAVGHGDPEDVPATDIFGAPRPPTRADAGASQG